MHVLDPLFLWTQETPDVTLSASFVWCHSSLAGLILVWRLLATTAKYSYMLLPQLFCLDSLHPCSGKRLLWHGRWMRT